MDSFFPEEFRWSQPDGGMFIWAEGPQGYDLNSAYEKAIANNVAFVPGRYFYAQPGAGLETMRLNFTMFDEQTLADAIAVLGRVLHEELR